MSRFVCLSDEHDKVFFHETIYEVERHIADYKLWIYEKVSDQWWESKMDIYRDFVIVMCAYEDVPSEVRLRHLILT